MKRLRAVKILAGVVLGFWALYLIAGNVILRTRLLRKWTSANEETMKVEYGSAWTWLPGRVHVRDLSLRFQDSNVQFLLELERAEFQVDPFALVKRTFHVTHVDARGARFLARHKLERLEENESRAASFAHIEGFADPPMKPAEPSKPIPDDQYKLWTVQLDDVSASLRELWIMEYRYRGAGSVAGAFRLKPVRELRIDPSVMIADGGVFSIGEMDLLLHAKGRIEAFVENYDVRVPQGPEVLRHFDARVDLDGDLASIAPFGSTYLDAAKKKQGFAVERGAGSLGVHGRAFFGPLTPESHVDYRTGDVLVKTPLGDAHGDVEAHARVVDGRLVADAAVGAGGFARGTIDVVRVHGARVHVDFGNGDVTAPFALAAVSGAVASAAAPDLRLLQPLAPPDVVLHGGAVDVAARASLTQDRAIDARADAKIERARVSGKSFDVSATSGAAWATVATRPSAGENAAGEPGAKAAGSEKRATDGAASVELRGASLRVAEAHAEGLAVDAAAKGTVAPNADATITVRAAPGDSVLRLVTTAASIPSAAADAVAGPDFRATAHVRAHAGALAVDVPSAKDGSFEAHGGVRKAKSQTNAEGKTRGAFVVSVGPVRAGVELKTGGGTSVTPAPKDTWLPDTLR